MLNFFHVVGVSSSLFYLLASAPEDPEDPDRLWTGVYVYSHGKWKTLGEFPDIWLVDMDVLSEGHLVAVSITGELYEYQRGSWTSTDELIPGVAFSVKSFGVDNYYVTGSDGLFHISSKRVKKKRINTKEELVDISGTDEVSFFIVGDNGTCIKKTGTHFHKENTRTKAVLTCVARIDEDRAFAAGWRGKVIARDPKRGWRSIPCPNKWDLLGISAVSTDLAYCAGRGLLKVEDDKVSVEIDPGQTGLDLTDILGVEEGGQIVVGSNETILIGPPWRAFSPKFKR